MYEAQMKMIIPPSVGIVVAGIASGICLLLLGSLRRGKGGKNVDDSRCACCLKPFLVGRGVECNDCGSRSCRKACCRWDSVDNSWFCLFCYHSRSWSRRKEKWFETFGGIPVEPESSKNFSTAKSRVYDEGAEDVAIHSELDLAAGGCQEGDSVETVREFVEKIVSGLVGNVDDTPIDRLYDHPAYKPATDTPTMAHTALRELVERAVDEARRLPGLGATVSTGVQEDPSFSEQNYEDLLATAILNKVIEKFQNERVDGNSNVLHRRPRSKHANHENEIGLDEGVEEGSSSLEPLSQDECSSEGSGPRSRHIRSRQEPLSLTIEEQIEEVTTTYTSDEEIRCSKTNVLDFRNARRVPFPEFGMDIVDPSQDSSEDSQEDANDLTHVDVITPVESWEENWLFQKRKIQTQSEPVSMLVPNPSADFRALIGDKDAEDTSDLSEFSAQSDDEADEDDLTEAINKVVPKSPRVENTDADFSLNVREIQQIDRSLQNKSSKKEDTLEFLQNGKLEIPAKNPCERNLNRDESSQLDPKQNSQDFVLLEAANYGTNNSEIPKTLATSPTRNSLVAKTPEVSIDCEVRRSTERLVSIDKPVEEEAPEAISLSNDKIRKEDKREEEIFLSSSAINQHQESSTMNGSPKVVSRGEDDVICEDESTDRGDEVERKIENGEAITNVSSSVETERRCQALAQARADSASEKPSSRNVTSDEIELATPPRPGTIAEREHKKWENAAPIENNPYSEENIQKRLLERQYARRSSDVSGNSSNLQTCPSPPLQIVLGAGRPDFKRFGRDYYINEAKFPKGHSVGDNGFYTATSRPNSALSQHSLSTGSDYEQQDLSRSVDTESTCSTSSESKMKNTSETQRNNVQTALRRGSIPSEKAFEATDTETRDSRNIERRQSLNDVSRDKNWNGRHWNDEIFERDRKNSKNEINAKLNNRENFEENHKPIRRIDLRAYGFANEFNVKNGESEEPRQPKRVVNKLDLRSFGYDSGLRRSQSNNNIDRRVNNIPLHSRPNVRNFVDKTNFNDHNGGRRYSALTCLASLGSSGDGILTKSTEILNEDTTISRENFGKITAAKSVPNIGDLYEKNGDELREGDYEEDDVGDVRNLRSSLMEKERSDSDEKSVDSMKNFEIHEKANGGSEILVAKELPMPSVRRLAQAFNKPETANALPARRVSKSVNNSSKERPTTPEIHIVDTPRQMHSLTARSLSREFREGLRQIGNKPTAVPTVKVISEHNQSTELCSPTNRLGSCEDVSVIAPGKLKNNIKFWEQLHRKS